LIILIKTPNDPLLFFRSSYTDSEINPRKNAKSSLPNMGNISSPTISFPKNSSANFFTISDSLSIFTIAGHVNLILISRIQPYFFCFPFKLLHKFSVNSQSTLRKVPLISANSAITLLEVPA